MPTDLKLVHGTSNKKLANIIQIKGLTGTGRYSDLGFKKKSGGEHGGSKPGLDSDKVSFFKIGKKTNTFEKHVVPLGYGEKKKFEYPISLGVSEKHYNDRKCFPEGIAQGAFASERTVKDFISLSCFDYLFAPPFALSELKEMIHAWKLDIKVMPFPQTN